jgi:hypothetical protein
MSERKNIFAYTPPGFSPPYLSINHEEHDVVSVTVRGAKKDEAETTQPHASIEIADKNQLVHLFASIGEYLYGDAVMGDHRQGDLPASHLDPAGKHRGCRRQRGRHRRRPHGAAAEADVMELCTDHWGAVTAGIKIRGLWDLQCNDPEDRAALIRAINGEQLPEDPVNLFDAVIAVQAVIYQKALDIVGMSLMASNKCPMCEAYALGAAPFADASIDQIMKAAIEHGLLKVTMQ